MHIWFYHSFSLNIILAVGVLSDGLFLDSALSPAVNLVIMLALVLDFRLALMLALALINMIYQYL